MPLTDASTARWGVFVQAPDCDRCEWHRWSDNDLVELSGRQAAETRAAEVRRLHPDWLVTAEQTIDPLPAVLHTAIGEEKPS